MARRTFIERRIPSRLGGALLAVTLAATGLVGLTPGTASAASGFDAVCPVAGVANDLGYTGDGSAATSAQLGIVNALAVAPNDDLYVGDRGFYRVYKVDHTTGVITTVAGGGGSLADGVQATDALVVPAGLAYDDARNALYVSDGNFGGVRKVDLATGVITTIAGAAGQYADGSQFLSGAPGDGGPATDARFVNPGVLALHGDDLYIADFRDDRIRRLDLTTGIIHRFAGDDRLRTSPRGDGGPATAANIYTPLGLTTDAAGNVYVTDETHTVRVITHDGVINRFAGSGNYGPPTFGTATPGSTNFGITWGLTAIPAPLSTTKLFVADNAAGAVLSVQADYPSPPDPRALQTDLVVGDGRAGSGGDGGNAAFARLNRPTALAATAQYLYVADAGNTRVRRVALGTGTITAWAGRGPDTAEDYSGDAESGGVSSPGDVAIDPISSPGPDVEYFIDATANRVRRFDAATSTVTTVAGNGAPSYPGTGYAGEHSAPASAAFDFSSRDNFVGGSRPRLAVTGSTVYVAEALPRIRRFDPSSSVATIAGDGIPDISGDGGPAVDARFTAISDLALEPGTNNLYVSDLSNPRVRQINGTTGLINSVVGTGVNGFSGDGGPAGAAQTPSVDSLTFDHAHHLFLAAAGRIRRVDVNNGVVGTITTIAGNGTEEHTGDGGPATAAHVGQVLSMGTDSAGNLFFSEYVNAAFVGIRRIDTTTGIITTIASGTWDQVHAPSGRHAVDDARFGYPVGIAVRPDGRSVTFADSTTSQLRSVNVGGCAAIRDPGMTGPAEASSFPIGGSIPTDAIPADRVPDPVADLGAAPIKRIDLAAAGLEASALADTALADIPIKRIALSSIPTTVGGGWAELLRGTSLEGVPLQNVTLDEVQALPTSDLPAASPARSLRLRDIDISSSPIKRISLASLALGAAPIKRIDLLLDSPPDDTLLPADAGSDAARFARWCGAGKLLAQLVPGFSCAGQGITDQSPLLAVDLASIPIKRIPIKRIPIKRILLENAPIKRIPIKRIDLTTAPIKRIPIKRIATSASPIKRIPLASLTPASRNAIVDCGLTDCSSATATLEDADAADAIRAGAQLGDVAPATAFDPYTLEDLGPAFIDTDSLADVLVGLVPRAALPWEDADLEALGLNTITGGTPTHVQATFRLFTDRPAGPVTVSATLGGDLAPTDAWQIVGPGTTGVVGPTGATRSGRTITFPNLPADAPAGVYTLDLDVLAGLQTGTFPVSVSVADAVTGETVATGEVKTVTVNDPTEVLGNDAIPVYANPGSLNLGHLGGDHTVQPDIDLYTVNVPNTPGVVTTVTLSHLAADGDLAVFPSVTTPPLRSGGFRRIGLQSAPPETTDPDLRSGIAGGQPQDTATIPLYLGHQPAAVSAQRGTTTEEINLLSRGEGGSYTIQVSNHNGATSPSPYLLYVRQTTPSGSTACPVRQSPAPDPGAVLPASLPSGTRTLFLVNDARLANANPDLVGSIKNQLATVAALPAVKGVVVPVDGDAAVRQAYAAWDANSCDVDNANAVVNRINDVVDSLAPVGSPARAELRSIVLVGGDDLIPMGRVPDRTTKSNESDYAGDARTLDANGVPTDGNPISAALANHNILTDDPYGDFDPIAWKDTALYVPDVALGRLVETPAAISAQLTAFATRNGTVAPTSSFTAGYDFLSDASTAIDGALATSIGGRVPAFARDTLISDTWTRGQLAAQLLPPNPAPVPGAVSLNAHFDHHQLLPAAGNTSGDTSDLLTAADVRNSGRLAGRIIFTLGCHSGLALPSSYAGSNAPADWAETFGDQDALYVANTGFGYGDSAAVALSERLMKLYAQHLDGTTTAGSALQLAKQEYFAGLAAFSDYDAKVMMESTFYGIPNYEVGTPTLPPAPPAALPVAPDPTTGISSAVVTARPSFATVTRPDGTSYSTADGLDPQVTAGQPIQPRTEIDVTQPSDLAHGALVTALSSTDSTVDATFAAPTVDDAAGEPATAATGAAFPSTLPAVSTYNSVTGQRQRLNLVTGQFVSAGDPAHPQRGTQRRFTEITARVLYRPAADTDFTAPTTSSVTASGTGSGIDFDVQAADPGGSVTRVLVLYRDGTTWRSVDLRPSGGHWLGTGATTTGSVDYFVQVVDTSGNVGVTSNKAANFTSVATPTPPANATPVVTLGADTTITAGATFSRTGSFTDADHGPWTATVDYGRTGDTAVPLPLTGTAFTLNAVYANAGSYRVTVTVCDAEHACGIRSVGVTVDPPPTTSAPTISVGDATVVEGDLGANPVLKFPVHLSQPSATPITLTYSTVAGSAASGTDYTAKTNATFTFRALVVNGVVSIPVKADTADEGDETLALRLGTLPTGVGGARTTGLGTIVDDDPGSGHGVAISDALVGEGNAKNRTVTLLVTLRSKDTAASHTVTYTTVAGTASGAAKATTGGGDYVTRTGTLLFKPGQFSKSITITLKPDTANEGNESFAVRLTAATGTSLVRGIGRVTIVDDD